MWFSVRAHRVRRDVRGPPDVRVRTTSVAAWRKRERIRDVAGVAPGEQGDWIEVRGGPGRGARGRDVSGRRTDPARADHTHVRPTADRSIPAFWSPGATSAMPGVTFAAGGDTHAADIPGVLALAHPVDADLLQRRGRVDAEPVRQFVPCCDREGVLRPVAE